MEHSIDLRVADWDGRAYSRSSELTCSSVEKAEHVCREYTQCFHRCLALSPTVGGVVLSSVHPRRKRIVFFQTT